MNLNRFFYTNFPKQYGKIQGLLNYCFLPFKLILFKLNNNIFFGEKNQDRWVVDEIFDYKKNGFFLDLAATDGLYANNTFFLEKRLKWKGICIEPNKKYFKKLIKRRTAQCICEVIDKEEKIIDFLPNGGDGGIIGDEYDNNEFKRHSLLSKARKKNRMEKRKTKTLLSILDDCGAPKIIDFFSLDVEGAETNILKKRELIFKYAVKNKWTLIEMNTETANLETIFRKLTN